MSARNHDGRLAVILPVAVGVALLGGALFLLPGQMEVRHAEQRAQPVATEAAPVPAPAAVAPPPQALPPSPPAIATLIPTADAATLATLTAELVAAGVGVTTRQVAYDLAAARRPAVALAYLAARPDGAEPTTWRLRADLLRATGRPAEAAAMLAAAVRGRGGVAPADIIATGYALDRPDLIVAAAASGAIPPPDAALALDLARRADRAGRDDLIVTLDRTTTANWRAADPWLAIRVATRRGDMAAALAAVPSLPIAQQEAAREAIVTKAGDRAALRSMLLARAEAPGAARETVAEQLLAAGYRDDAIAVLKGAAVGQPVDSRGVQRLLYLMGPRPAAADRAWLREQALRGGAAEQRAWLAVYADHDRPADALAFATRHPLASQTDILLKRAALARAAGDAAAGRAAIAGLLDGRALDAAQVRAMSAVQPAGLDAAQASAITRLRVATGVAAPSDRLDLAWAAWNGGDARQAATWLRGYLADAPTDAAALRLMADVQAKTGGAAAARPWLERALAQTPAKSRAQAELLDRLGRDAEALRVVEELRRDAPRDRALAAMQARLLIAQGQPGAARTVLQP
ncbi:hypothetical protein ASE75_04430 [Sphingomonas sp. Leaf17]|uniref:hypothetical protein n=1 Tax=Sphingomonas sp. Leaf17 TaxID=1735683 RepID=UPI0006F28D13|nr:hypothetical protein [Sphingomonas sp. Leaf17]KQM65515.1 hypothetical protein ASE75_04430 [Sphingomonas sp. Leaf17]